MVKAVVSWTEPEDCSGLTAMATIPATMHHLFACRWPRPILPHLRRARWAPAPSIMKRPREHHPLQEAFRHSILAGWLPSPLPEQPQMSSKPQLAVLACASFVVASIYALVLAQAPLERLSRNEPFVSG